MDNDLITLFLKKIEERETYKASGATLRFTYLANRQWLFFKSQAKKSFDGVIDVLKVASYDITTVELTSTFEHHLTPTDTLVTEQIRQWIKEEATALARLFEDAKIEYKEQQEKASNKTKALSAPPSSTAIVISATTTPTMTRHRNPQSPLAFYSKLGMGTLLLMAGCVLILLAIATALHPATMAASPFLTKLGLLAIGSGFIHLSTAGIITLACTSLLGGTLLGGGIFSYWSAFSRRVLPRESVHRGISLPGGRPLPTESVRHGTSLSTTPPEQSNTTSGNDVGGPLTPKSEPKDRRSSQSPSDSESSSDSHPPSDSESSSDSHPPSDSELPSQRSKFFTPPGSGPESGYDTPEDEPPTLQKDF